MNHRYRRTSRQKTEKVETSTSTNNKPFESSIASILIDKCDRCTLQLQKQNLKAAKQIIANLDKDLALLHNTHADYARLMSLIFNTKAGYHRKCGQNQQALRFIDEAISIQRTGNVDRIDMARTLLNKSVIMGQMARQDKNLYSHQSAISLAKEALQIIKNRPQGKQFVHKDQYKLGQIIIISFHNIATQLVCLKNQKEGYNLYKKAYDLALRVLGPRHNLTIHLRNIINRYKQQKKQSRRAVTQQTSLSPTKSKLALYSNVSKNTKRRNFIAQNKKFKNFFKIYGYSKEVSHEGESFHKDNQIDMKDLSKLKKIYKPSSTNSYFPDIQNRKNIRQIINQGRQLAAKRPHVASVAENQREKSQLRFESKTSKKSSIKKLQKLKTQQIYIQQQPIQQNIPKKQEVKQTKVQPQLLKQDGGCQLI